jgi:hypothetical protein
VLVRDAERLPTGGGNGGGAKGLKMSRKKKGLVEITTKVGKNCCLFVLD